MDEEIIPSESLPDSSGGIEADNQEAVSLKDIVAEEIGKEYSSDEEALKAIKETFSYVGKVGKFQPLLNRLQEKVGGEEKLLTMMENLASDKEAQPQVPAIDPDRFVSREQYETDTFFSSHPELAEHKTLLNALRQSTGKTLVEVAEMPEFVGIYEKAKSHDASEQSKSVLMTSPRLGQVKDKITSAQEAAQKGDHVSAGKSATQAVLDAYDLQ